MSAQTLSLYKLSYSNTSIIVFSLIQGPPNNFFWTALKKTTENFLKIFFYLKVQPFPLIMENNFIQMAASAGHAVAYTVGPILKYIIDCVHLYCFSCIACNGFTNTPQIILQRCQITAPRWPNDISSSTSAKHRVLLQLCGMQRRSVKPQLLPIFVNKNSFNMARLRSPLTITAFPCSFSMKNSPITPLDQNPHQTVTRFWCVGFSMYACGFSVPQMRQFCLFTYPRRSK